MIVFDNSQFEINVKHLFNSLSFPDNFIVGLLCRFQTVYMGIMSKNNELNKIAVIYPNENYVTECPLVSMEEGTMDPSASCDCSGHSSWSFCPSSAVNKATITLKHLYLATHLLLAIPSSLNWSAINFQLSLGTQAGLHLIPSSEVSFISYKYYLSVHILS